MAFSPQVYLDWAYILATAHVRRDSGRTAWEAETGYDADTLNALWAKAQPFFCQVPDKRGGFKPREKELWKGQHYFYLFFMYIHDYPTEEVGPTFLRTSKISNLQLDTFYKCILPLARNWSVQVDHIRWAERLDPMNHHVFFPTDVTVLWDTTCIRVQKAADWTVARYNVNGHYDFPCFLVLIGITFLGDIVYASGLLRSTSYDAHSFEDTKHMHPQQAWERNIGDGHFGTLPRFSLR